MAVIGDSKVCVLAYIINGKETEMVMATLDKGAKEITLQSLNSNTDLEIKGGILRFNPVSQKLILLASFKSGKKEKFYTISIAYLDPSLRKIERSFNVYPVHANEKCTELFGEKHSFGGMPQNLYVNNDGSFSIVYEEMTNYYTNNGTSSWCDLGNIAVSQFDKDGREANSYFIPKNHYIFKSGLNTFYQSERDGTAQYLKVGDQFKSFSYLNGKEKTYILMNDIEENAKSVLKGKITPIRSVGECDGFYYVISGNEIMPARNFVFGKPESKKENNLAIFSISDYDRERNIYVTLKLEKDGRKKAVKLVWLQPK